MGIFGPKIPFSGPCEGEGKWGVLGPRSPLFQETGGGCLGSGESQVYWKNSFLELHLWCIVPTNFLAQISWQARIHRALQGAPPTGRQLYFTFPSAPDPFFKVSKAPFLTLRVATPSGAARQAPLEGYRNETYKDFPFCSVVLAGSSVFFGCRPCSGKLKQARGTFRPNPTKDQKRVQQGLSVMTKTRTPFRPPTPMSQQ